MIHQVDPAGVPHTSSRRVCTAVCAVLVVLIVLIGYISSCIIITVYVRLLCDLDFSQEFLQKTEDSWLHITGGCDGITSAGIIDLSVVFPSIRLMAPRYVRVAFFKSNFRALLLRIAACALLYLLSVTFPACFSLGVLLSASLRPAS